MKGMSQALQFGKSIMDNGWGMFTSFLQYKLKEQRETTDQDRQMVSIYKDVLIMWFGKRNSLIRTYLSMQLWSKYG